MVSFLSMHPTESRYWERGRDDVVEKAHILCGSLIMMAMIQYWWPLMLSSWYRVHCIAAGRLAGAAWPAGQQRQPRNRGWQCRPLGQSGSRALLNTYYISYYVLAPAELLLSQMTLVIVQVLHQLYSLANGGGVAVFLGSIQPHESLSTWQMIFFPLLFNTRIQLRYPYGFDGRGYGMPYIKVIIGK